MKDPKILEKKASLRKLERQAKQLLYKMSRIETEWNKLREDLRKSGTEVPYQLGDVLHGWTRKEARA